MKYTQRCFEYNNDSKTMLNIHQIKHNIVLKIFICQLKNIKNQLLFIP